MRLEETEKRQLPGLPDTKLAKERDQAANDEIVLQILKITSPPKS